MRLLPCQPRTSLALPAVPPPYPRPTVFLPSCFGWHRVGSSASSLARWTLQSLRLRITAPPSSRRCSPGCQSRSGRAVPNGRTFSGTSLGCRAATPLAGGVCTLMISFDGKDRPLAGAWRPHRDCSTWARYRVMSGSVANISFLSIDFKGWSTRCASHRREASFCYSG